MFDLLQLCSFFYVAASDVCSVIAVSMDGLWSVTVECPCHTYLFFEWHLHLLVIFTCIGALSCVNLSSVFPTKQDSNQSPQLQRLARKLKFHL